MGQAFPQGILACREIPAGCGWAPAESGAARQAAWRTVLGEAEALLVEGTTDPPGIQDSVDGIEELEGECRPDENPGFVVCPWFEPVPELQPLRAGRPGGTCPCCEPEGDRRSKPVAEEGAGDQVAGMVSMQATTRPPGTASVEFPERMARPVGEAPNALERTGGRVRIPLEIPELRPPALVAAARPLGHSAGEALLIPVAAETESPASGDTVTVKGGGSWPESAPGAKGISPETRARQSDTQAGWPSSVAVRSAGGSASHGSGVAVDFRGPDTEIPGQAGSGQSASLPCPGARQQNQSFGEEENPARQGGLREGARNELEGAPKDSAFPPGAGLAAENARMIHSPAAGRPAAEGEAGRAGTRGGVAVEPARTPEAPPAPAGGRQLELQVEGAQGERVRIRLTDSLTGVRLRMASNEARLAATLRAGWPELEQALQAAGWKAERVAEAAPRAAAAAVVGFDEPGPVRGGSLRPAPEMAWHWQEAFRSSHGRGDSHGSRGRRQDALREEWLDLSALRRLSARRHS